MSVMLAGRINHENGEISLGGLKAHVQWGEKSVAPLVGTAARRAPDARQDVLASARRLIICACGTSWHAALVGEYLLESLAGIPVEVEYASEFR